MLLFFYSTMSPRKQFKVRCCLIPRILVFIFQIFGVGCTGMFGHHLTLNGWYLCNFFISISFSAYHFSYWSCVLMCFCCNVTSKTLPVRIIFLKLAKDVAIPKFSVKMEDSILSVRIWSFFSELFGHVYKFSIIVVE